MHAWLFVADLVADRFAELVSGGDAEREPEPSAVAQPLSITAAVTGALGATALAGPERSSTACPGADPIPMKVIERW